MTSRELPDRRHEPAERPVPVDHDTLQQRLRRLEVRLDRAFGHLTVLSDSIIAHVRLSAAIEERLKAIEERLREGPSGN
jgi:uncharacterized coiled-coil protein SlyX